MLEGVEQEVPVDDVGPGDLVLVRPGEKIPVDGVVLSGVGLVDQQKLTGESIPILREAGQDVLAATLVRLSAAVLETLMATLLAIRSRSSLPPTPAASRPLSPRWPRAGNWLERCSLCVWC